MFLRPGGFGQHTGKSWHTLLSKTPPRCPEELEDTRKNAQDVPKLSPGPSKTPSKAAETSPKTLVFLRFFIVFRFHALDPSWHLLGPSRRHVAPSWRAYLAPTWPVLAPSYSHFGPSALSKNPSKRNFLNVPQIYTFPTNFQYFCKSAPIELQKKINIIFFPSDVTLDRFGTTLAAEPTPKTPPKSSFLNVPNTHFSNDFSIFLQVLAHRFTDCS